MSVCNRDQPGPMPLSRMPPARNCIRPFPVMVAVVTGGYFRRSAAIRASVEAELQDVERVHGWQVNS
jgi:hypothetical protein